MLKGTTGNMYATTKWVGSYDRDELEKVAKAYAKLRKCGRPHIWDAYDFEHKKIVYYFMTDRIYKTDWSEVVNKIGLRRKHVDDTLKNMWFLKRNNGLSA